MEQQQQRAAAAGMLVEHAHRLAAAAAAAGGDELHQPAPQQQQQAYAAAAAAAQYPVVHGGTPLGQIGAGSVPPQLQLQAGGPGAGPAPLDAVGQLSPCPTTPGGSADDCDSGGDFAGRPLSRKQKRGVLPKHATSVMRSWLFQHLVVSNLSTLSFLTT